MLFHPAIIALLLASSASALLVLSSAAFGLKVVRHWDIASGSERQLALERRTYLISTLLSLVFAAQLASLLLFVFNADRMAVLFVGAMCGVGTLNVNAFGFPALALKILVFFLASSWLMLNYVDNRGYDYPLVRIKYRFLLFIAPVILVAALTELLYFLGLKADVITSCCGSLFSASGKSLVSEMSSLPPLPSLLVFYGTLGVTLLGGVHFFWRQRGGYLFAGLSVLAFLVAIAAIISFLSLYIYEHPNHHCPLCILKEDYNYFGYGLYIPLFGATAAGLGVGVIRPFARIPSIAPTVHTVSRRFTLSALALFALFALLATWAILHSNLVLIEN